MPAVSIKHNFWAFGRSTIIRRSRSHVRIAIWNIMPYVMVLILVPKLRSHRFLFTSRLSALRADRWLSL
jgi:hypothetical protein